MNKSQGAILPVSLLLLFVITLIGVSSTQVTQMQEKMSANLQDKILSFNAAESGLAAGEAWILGQLTQPISYASCPSFPCIRNEYENIDFATQPDSWWNANSTALGVDLTDVYSQPRYVIEFVQFVPDSLEIGSSTTSNRGVYYYQLTSKGVGASANSVTIIQSALARRY